MSDFNKSFQEKLKQFIKFEVPALLKKDIQYFDESSNTANAKLVECAEKNLQNVWTPHYRIVNIMQEYQPI